MICRSVEKLWRKRTQSLDGRFSFKISLRVPQATAVRTISLEDRRVSLFRREPVGASTNAMLAIVAITIEGPITFENLYMTVVSCELDAATEYYNETLLRQD